MSTLTDLQQQFSLPGVVAIEPGTNGLPRVAIATPDADAHVYLHGAHVTHYQRRGRPPLLFMSARSYFETGKPIRGGVPLIFPWFGPARDPKLPAHGFARTKSWTLSDITRADDGSVTVSLTLAADDATRALWPHEFELVYRVIVGPSLGLELEVRNIGHAPFAFDEAFHTYLAVADVRAVTVAGLGNRPYLDKMDGARLKTQAPQPFPIVAEIDRVYLDTPDAVRVDDPGLARTITVAKENSSATVVWNPWVAKAKAMADFGDDAWPAMLCIETANADRHAVTLVPGGRHAMRANVKDEPREAR